MWKPPSKNWIKVSFDSASRGNSGISRVGEISKNEWGDIVTFFVKHLRDDTTNIAEVQVALLAIKLGRKMGVNKILLEVDSKIIMDGIKRGSLQAWYLQDHIQEIRDVLYTFGNFQISHT